MAWNIEGIKRFCEVQCFLASDAVLYDTCRRVGLFFCFQHAGARGDAVS